MNSIPIRYFLFTLFLLATSHVHAQIRTDLIYKLDKTTFNAIVDEIGESEILYFSASDTAKRMTLRIEKGQIWKIVYANGETEVINEPIVTKAEELQKTSVDQIVLADNEPSLHREKRSSRLNYNRSDVPKVSFSVGGHYSSVLADLNLGFKSGYGNRAQIAIGLKPRLAFAISVSYNKYVIERLLINANEEIVYKTDATLKNLPVLLGLKIYPAWNLYLMPSILVNSQRLTMKSNLFGSTNDRTTGLGVGGTIGYDVSMNSFFVDVFASYQWQPIRDLTNPVFSLKPAKFIEAGIMVGISSKKKN